MREGVHFQGSDCTRLSEQETGNCLDLSRMLTPMRRDTAAQENVQANDECDENFKTDHLQTVARGTVVGRSPHAPI